MATSTKVLFKLSSLRERALEAIEERIYEADAELERLENDEVLVELRQDWRRDQSRKLIDLVDKLHDVPDEQLARFKLDELPKVDQWAKQRARQQLRQLRAQRDQIAAKADSLVADEDGNIALTKTQMQEFFGL